MSFHPRRSEVDLLNKCGRRVPMIKVPKVQIPAPHNFIYAFGAGSSRSID